MKPIQQDNREIKIKELKRPEPMKCPATGNLYVPSNQMLFSNQCQIVDKLNEIIKSL